MSVFTANELVDATRRANEIPELPLAADDETHRVLMLATEAAYDELPPHHRCAEVRFSLVAVFLMGVSAGVELGRGT